MSKLWLALPTALVLWASSFPAIKVGLSGYAPLELAALRFLVASAALGLVAPLAGVRLPRRADVPALLGLGLVGVAAYHALLNFGETVATAGAAGFIVNMAPIFSAMLARFDR